MVTLNYPPEKIYRSSKASKPNYDHVILWMVHNNDVCTWANFSKEPIKIPLGTLSRHLEQLQLKGYIDKVSRGHYKITPEGIKQFNELSSGKKKGRKLKYPPKAILKTGRNYAHWILWMVYNNTYCIRLDFLDPPISINQSSLKKNLDLLIEKKLLLKDEKKYLITQLGKLEYSKMLQRYDLDRQTILEEESKKIEVITKKTLLFFNDFKVKDKEIQFTFLNNILKLDYDRVKTLIEDEETFFKIVLFLSINHPNNYPNFISSADFSARYKIKKTTLDFFIDQISEGKLYPTKYFKLESSSSGDYYFHTGGKIERMLQVITESQINKFMYLNKLFSKTLNKPPRLDVNLIINQILDEICGTIFDNNLKESLRVVLPDYIKYLAYKIEIKKELVDSYDKLEGIIWQDMAKVFDSQISGDLQDQFEEEIKEIDNELSLNPKDIELYHSKMKILIYFNQYNDVLSLLDKMIEEFPKKEIDLMMKKASIFRKKKNLEAGLEIIEDLIIKFPKNSEILSYKAFWFQYLDRKEDAFEIIQGLIDKEPDNGIYLDNYGEILMYFKEYEEAIKKFLKVILMDGGGWYIYQSYIKLGICYRALGTRDDLALALNNLKKGKEIANKSPIDPDIKHKWLVIADLFLSEME